MSPRPKVKSFARSYNDSLFFLKNHKCLNANVSLVAKFKYKLLFKGLMPQISNLIQPQEPLASAKNGLDLMMNYISKTEISLVLRLLEPLKFHKGLS